MQVVAVVPGLALVVVGMALLVVMVPVVGELEPAAVQLLVVVVVSGRSCLWRAGCPPGAGWL